MIRVTPLIAFPDGFLWGAGTSAHQSEGGNVNNHYWIDEHELGSPFIEPSGDAVDHYHRWREDLDLLAAAGLNTYRFSLEWSRIEPEEGEISRAALQHYERVLHGCHERGLVPVVTLSHITMPRWMARDGGWRGPTTAERFARYVETVLPVVSDAAYVCTLNEPNFMACLPVIAAMRARGEPFAGLPRPDQQMADVLMETHHRGMEVLRGSCSVPAGLTLGCHEFLPEDGAVEQMAAHRTAVEDQFFPAAAGDDFVGMQVYSCARVGPHGLVGAPPEHRTLADMEYRPQALGAVIARVSEMLPGMPLLITENGIATADDAQRIAHTEQALRSLHEAVTRGADVRGYVHWSLLDNFEWHLGFHAPFGLVTVDRATFARTPKPSLAWLGAVAHRNGLPG